MPNELMTAEMVATVIENALKYDAYLGSEALKPLVPPLAQSAAAIRTHLAGKGADTAQSALDAQAQLDDAEHDRAQRFFYGLVDTIAQHAPLAADREAAAFVRDTLYADGLRVVNYAFAAEVAAGLKFEMRLANPDVKSRVEALAAIVPGLGEFARATVAAAKALGVTLQKLHALRVDKAGKPFDPVLFKARTDALVWWSAFTNVVEAVYRGDAPASLAAREALLGPWRRLLASGAADASTTEPAPGPTSSATTTAPAVTA